ncbi:hypothetical protein B1218_37050, partial [Pseudomonas ogarae]
RGLSGPAILQISSFWEPGATVQINLLPDHEGPQGLQKEQADLPNSAPKTWRCYRYSRTRGNTRERRAGSSIGWCCWKICRRGRT